MHGVASPASLLIVLLGSAVLGAALTALALAYAHRAQLLDAPGRRRSHALPTPRGGGIGPVLAWVAALAAIAALVAPLTHALPLAGGTLLVAGIGAIDDHRPLPAWPRLLVHALAGAWLVLAVQGVPATAVQWAVLAALVALLVGVLNFWNFMDGIDGLAGSQTVFVALALAVVALVAGQPVLALAAAALATAVLGFLPFNLPVGRRARIFLGDVGSGALGFAVGGLSLLAWSDGAAPAAVLLLLPSAFLVDAGLTLASRMLSGRRWYTAHREHLYQWLVRRKFSHARVVALFLAWNLLIVTPLAIAVLVHRAPPLPALASGLAAGAVAWLAARRALLAHARRMGSPR